MSSDERVRRYPLVGSNKENSSLNTEQVGFGLCPPAFSPTDGPRSSFRKVVFFLQHDRKNKLMILSK